MALTKNEMLDLRKKYPAEYYSFNESNGRISITPKKQVIRVFKNLITEKTKDLDTLIDVLVAQKGLEAKDFEQVQVTIKKRTGDLITQEAKKCRTRKLIYLNKLLENASE